MIDRLHIDIYSLILSHLALIAFMFQLSKVFRKIEDARLRAELDNLLLNYSGALGAGDWIVWPIVLTVIYPLYSLIYLSIKRKLWLLITIILTDRMLVGIAMFIIALWITSTLFALMHWFIAYAITFAIGLAVYIFKPMKN